MINNGLQDMFTINLVNKTKNAPFPTFGPGSFCFRDIKLGCPRIVVQYSEEDKYHVLYQIRITSGTFVVSFATHPKDSKR